MKTDVPSTASPVDEDDNSCLNGIASTGFVNNSLVVNPDCQIQAKFIHAFQERFDDSGQPRKSNQEVNDNGEIKTNGFLIFGKSHIGKTVAIDRILLSYPQMVFCNRDGWGPEINQPQLMWLRLDCLPGDSNPGFCSRFFQALDFLLESLNSKDKEC